MESEGSEPGLIYREPSFSSYCSNTLAELVSMEEASEQHHLDYDFEFDWLPESENNVLPLFNRAASLLEVETIKKDNVLPPLDVKKSEGLLQLVNYKKSNSVGSSSRRWSFKGLLRRSNSERGAPTRTNNSNNTEEEKQGEKLGWDGFIHHLCPCFQPTVPANSLPTHAEEVNEEKVVVMEKKFSSKSSSSGSDRSDNRVFPIQDPEIVPQDKSQHDNVAVMKEDDDSTSSEVEKSEEVKYKKSKSNGSLLRQWSSLKGLLRRSSSERRALRSTDEGTEDSFVLSGCFSLSSRSSSKVSSTLVEEGEKLKSEGCMLYLCPCLASPPANSMPRPKEADQDKAVLKEKKPIFKWSTGSDGSKNNKSADLGKVDGVSKRPKIQNNAHKVYLKRNSKSWEASTPYRVDTIGFFPMVRPLMFLTASASASLSCLVISTRRRQNYFPRLMIFGDVSY